jgi:alpha-galactosidase
MINSGFKKFALVSVILMLLLSCQDKSGKLNYDIPKSGNSKALVICADSIAVNGDLGDFSVSRSLEKEADGVLLLTFLFSAETPSELKPVVLQFKFPSIDINGYWNPKANVDKVNYYYSAFSSKASQNAPVLSFYNNALENRICIALSDAINKAEFKCYLKEEDVHFHPEIKLFQEKMSKTKSYQLTLRIDTRALPYYKVIDDVASWWAKDDRYQPMLVPDAAKRPMYSTWYSYHQNISADEIVAECKIAKTLGCEAVIVDDGW